MNLGSAWKNEFSSDGITQTKTKIMGAFVNESNQSIDQSSASTFWVGGFRKHPLLFLFDQVRALTELN